jgi:hypothetical protein
MNLDLVVKSHRGRDNQLIENCGLNIIILKTTLQVSKMNGGIMSLAAAVG